MKIFSLAFFTVALSLYLGLFAFAKDGTWSTAQEAGYKLGYRSSYLSAISERCTGARNQPIHLISESLKSGWNDDYRQAFTAGKEAGKLAVAKDKELCACHTIAQVEQATEWLCRPTGLAAAKLSGESSEDHQEESP